MAEQGNRAPFINEREDFDEKMEQLDQCIEAVGMLGEDFQRGLDESTVTREEWTRYNAFHEKHKARMDQLRVAKNQLLTASAKLGSSKPDDIDTISRNITNILSRREDITLPIVIQALAIVARSERSLDSVRGLNGTFENLLYNLELEPHRKEVKRLKELLRKTSDQLEVLVPATDPGLDTLRQQLEDEKKKSAQWVTMLMKSMNGELEEGVSQPSPNAFIVQQYQDAVKDLDEERKIAAQKELEFRQLKAKAQLDEKQLGAAKKRPRTYENDAVTMEKATVHAKNKYSESKTALDSLRAKYAQLEEKLRSMENEAGGLARLQESVKDAVKDMGSCLVAMVPNNTGHDSPCSNFASMIFDPEKSSVIHQFNDFAFFEMQEGYTEDHWVVYNTARKSGDSSAFLFESEKLFSLCLELMDCVESICSNGDDSADYLSALLATIMGRFNASDGRDLWILRLMNSIPFLFVKRISSIDLTSSVASSLVVCGMAIWTFCLDFVARRSNLKLNEQVIEALGWLKAFVHNHACLEYRCIIDAINLSVDHRRNEDIQKHLSESLGSLVIHYPAERTSFIAPEQRENPLPYIIVITYGREEVRLNTITPTDPSMFTYKVKIKGKLQDWMYGIMHPSKVAGVSFYHTPDDVEHKWWQKYVMPTIRKTQQLDDKTKKLLEWVKGGGKLMEFYDRYDSGEMEIDG